MCLAVLPVGDREELEACFSDDPCFGGRGGGFSLFLGEFGKFGGHGVDPEGVRCDCMLVGWLGTRLVWEMMVGWVGLRTGPVVIAMWELSLWWLDGG